MSEVILDATQLPDPETMPIEDMDVSHPISVSYTHLTLPTKRIV